MVRRISGFANTLGYDNYYGLDEFNNDEEYDGFGEFGMNLSSNFKIYLR